MIETIRGNGKAGGVERAAGRLVQALQESVSTVDLLYERIAELEGDIHEQGWGRLGDDEFQFSRDWLDKTIKECRLFALKNPLVKRAVQLTTYYTWGQGVTVKAEAGDVNLVVQRFLNDPSNVAALSGELARDRLDRRVSTDGNLFLRLFMTPATGRLIVRPLRTEQVRAVHRNPDDENEVWFYQREFTDAKGGLKRVLYPDAGYRPRARDPQYKGVDVEWDTPVRHYKTDDLEGFDFGVPEVYAALDWAKAYKEYLSDWKKLVRSLTRWAYKATTPGGADAVAALKAKLSSTLAEGDYGTSENNPSPVTGGVAVMNDQLNLEPMPLRGATISADDGRRLLLMVCAAVGIPETFFGDVSVGTLATARSLDRPTEFKFLARQAFWRGVYSDLCQDAIDAAAKAPDNELPIGDRDPVTGAIVLGSGDDGEALDRTVTVKFPALLEREPGDMVSAIVSAATLDGKAASLITDPRLLAELIFNALQLDDVDDLLARLFPDQDSGDADAGAGGSETQAPEAGAGAAREARMAEALGDLARLLARPHAHTEYPQEY